MSPVTLLIGALLDSAWRRPDTVVTHTDTWFQSRTPSSPLSLHNSVRLAVLEEAQVDARIDAVLTDHRDRSAEFMWTVTPRCRPVDLAQRLLARGLVQMDEAWGMVRDTRIPIERVPEDVVVSPLEPGDDEDYVAACVAAWGADNADPDAVRESLVLARGHGENQFFLARRDGRAIGTAHMRFPPGCGYLMGASVVPAQRGTGVYRALTEARLQVLRARKVDVAGILAMVETSGPACLRMGFEHVCTFHAFRQPGD